jgi:hypothetical protein
MQTRAKETVREIRRGNMALREMSAAREMLVVVTVKERGFPLAEPLRVHYFVVKDLEKQFH